MVTVNSRVYFMCFCIMFKKTILEKKVKSDGYLELVKSVIVSFFSPFLFRDFAAGICNKISEMIQGMCYLHVSDLHGLN